MEIITLNDIAGLATEKMTWRLLYSLSKEWHSGSLSNVSPKSIEVNGDHFDVANDSATPQDTSAWQAPERGSSEHAATSEASEVWTLGLLAYYSIMGTDILENQGGLAQTADTLIPRIGLAHCGHELSDLIYSCLNYHPAKRPSMSDIATQAAHALQQPSRVPKRLTDDSGRVYQSSLVSFWPEEMTVILLLLFFSLIPFTLMAQGTPDIPSEMETLVKRCIQLRQPANVSNVTRQLQYDNQWTLMDEIAIDRNGECTTKDPVETFGLNDIGYRIFKLHSGVTNEGGRFRDGRDPRYKYSFIEITVKHQATVNYNITGREGSQLIAIVPYSSNAKFSAMVTNGTATMRNGVCYLYIKEKLKPSDHFKLTIKNESGSNMAFAIINYNSRK